MIDNNNIKLDSDIILAALEQSPGIVMITDTDGKIEYVNPHFTVITGYTREEVIGKNPSFLKSGTTHRDFYTGLWSSLKQGKSWHGELCNRKKNGKIYWESAAFSVIKNENGKVLHYMKVAEDITERKRALEALQGSYEFLEIIMNSAIDTMFVFDSRGDIIMANSRAEELTGYTVGELIGMSSSRLIPDAEFDAVNEYFSSQKDRSGSVEQKTTLMRKDAALRTIKYRLVPLIQHNRLRGIIGTAEDVTGQSLAEGELRKLIQAVQQSPATVVITDTEGNIEYVNPKFTQLTGYEFHEVIGKNPRIMKSGSQPDEFYKELWETITGGREWRGEFHNLKKDGGAFWEFSSISPVKDEKGVITHYVAVKEDITERKLAQNALIESENRLRVRNDIIEYDLKNAQTIQKALLPKKVPRKNGFLVQYRYIPLEAVGGDFFTFHDVDPNTFSVFVGDVTGHGVSAALFTALLKFTTQKMDEGLYTSPADYILHINKELLGVMSGYFITALYAIFSRDTISGKTKISFARGGHPYPVLLKKNDNSIAMLKSKGTILGMFNDLDIHEKSVELEKGDRVYLFTDGIIEVYDSKKEMLGLEGLSKIIKSTAGETLSDSIESILRKVEEFQGIPAFEDDMAIIGVEIT